MLSSTEETLADIIEAFDVTVVLNFRDLLLRVKTCCPCSEGSLYLVCYDKNAVFTSEIIKLHNLV